MSDDSEHPRVPGWAGATLYQFASGAALAVGILGVARSGRDVWLGASLLVLGALFALRGVALMEEQHERANDQLRKEIESVKQRLRTRQVDETAEFSRWRRRLRWWAR